MHRSIAICAVALIFTAGCANGEGPGHHAAENTVSADCDLDTLQAFQTWTSQAADTERRLYDAQTAAEAVYATMEAALARDDPAAMADALARSEAFKRRLSAAYATYRDDVIAASPRWIPVMRACGFAEDVAGLERLNASVEAWCREMGFVAEGIVARC